MASKISVILCEGPHDVAFITKILKTIGYKSNEKEKIGWFPKPISDLFLSEVTKANVNDLNMQEVRQALLPSNTLQKEETYLFLYALGGDTKVDSRKKIVSHLNSFIPQKGEIAVLPIGTTLSVIYFFDADKEGVQHRLDYINNEISSFFGASPFKASGTFEMIEGIQFGCYIFSKESEETGKLEDILVPILSKENENIFQEAKVFLSKNYTSTRGKKGDYDEQKSLIGIAGQLQKSGSTNTVIIGQTDYLTNEKILADSKCNEIIAFFNQI